MKIIYYALLAGLCALVSAAPTSGPKGAQLRDGWYFIKNPETGKYLQAADITDPAGNVVISSETKDDSQKWKLTNLGNGLVTLTTALGDFSIDVSGGDTSNGANIQLYRTHSDVNQQLMILKTRTDNVYTIGTKVSYFAKALDIEGALGTRSPDGTNVLQWANEMKDNQVWMFEPESNFDFEDSCWSLPLGYPCCSQCGKVYFQDNDGKWSVENDDWCGLLTHCM